jgi:hypothetical protein
MVRRNNRGDAGQAADDGAGPHPERGRAHNEQCASQLEGSLHAEGPQGDWPYQPDHTSSIDWYFKDCQDYLVDLEMATIGAIMALRLANNDFNSSQNDHQITCLSTRAREARVMTLQLRQSHLDVMLRNASPSAQFYGSLCWEEPSHKERPSIRMLSQAIHGSIVLEVWTTPGFLGSWRNWCQGRALARDECVHRSSLQEERVSPEEKKSLFYLYIYICFYACVHVPPPPLLRLFSSLVHKIENNLIFPGSRPHKPLILCLTSPPPFSFSLHIHRR